MTTPREAREKLERIRTLREIEKRRRESRVDHAAVLRFIQKGPKYLTEPTFKCHRCRDIAYIQGTPREYRGAKYECVKPCPFCEPGIAVLTSLDRPRTIVRTERPPQAVQDFRSAGELFPDLDGGDS